MFEEAQRLVTSPAYEAAARFEAPAQVIVAQEGGKPSGNRKELFNALGGVKELQVVEDADHQFTEDNSVERLLANTQRWFDHFSA